MGGLIVKAEASAEGPHADRAFREEACQLLST